jgi:hypothetical protein
VQEAFKAIDLPQLGGGEGWTPAPRGGAPDPEPYDAPGLPEDNGTDTAEDRFRNAIRAIHNRGDTPTSRLIFEELGMSSVSLNSRQAGWRRDELEQLGYVRDGNQYVRRDSK